VLLAVVDGGSLSAGGRKLNMSLPSVSRKMAELEYRLGARLLIRTARNIQLTDAGRDYVDSIRPIVAQLEEVERRAAGEYDEPRGELTVTVPGEGSRFFGAALTLEFLEHYPEISLNLISEERNLDLIEDRVDVGIRLGELTDSPLYAVKVGDIALATCASPNYLKRKGRPAHPSELSDHDGVFFGGLRPAGWIYSVDGKPFESCPRSRVRTNRLSTCIDAVIKGLGITRMGRSALEDELRSGCLTMILDDYECAALPVHLVFVKQGSLPLKVRAFLDWMTPRMRDKINELNSICSEQPKQKVSSKVPA
jgi:DNA-binding transcriptional LysR family regulator